MNRNHDSRKKRRRCGGCIPVLLLTIVMLVISVHTFSVSSAGDVVVEITEPSILSTEPVVPTETIAKDPVDAAADELLKRLIWDGATAEEQVREIYRWTRSLLSYGGHSDRTDWRQTAYTMLTDGKGDCFGYYAVTKLLFERLGIPNIDVQKVRNYEDDSDHFWSLVSVDGGETYYHFDATPRYGDGDDFCLVTDAFLDAYSESHKGSHNRDKSLYPETPEESL